MDISMIALQGLQQADTQLNIAASTIASLGAGASDGTNVDTVDLSAAVVALLAAKNQFSVNVATLKMAGEIQKNSIDIMA